MDIRISPSILGANYCNLEKDIKELEASGIKTIHIDVMDGNFVPNIAFGIDMIKAIRSITTMELDVHLMVDNPERFVDSLVEAGADSITVHAEACPHLYKTIYTIKSFGIKAGVALNPATPIEMIKHVTEMINMVLVMTVEPGFGGQKFIPFMLNKISEIKRQKDINNLQYDIQVDGGMNMENISEVIEAGANDIVIGSSIFNENGIKRNVRSFYKLLNIE